MTGSPGPPGHEQHGALRPQSAALSATEFHRPRCIGGSANLPAGRLIAGSAVHCGEDQNPRQLALSQAGRPPCASHPARASIECWLRSAGLPRPQLEHGVAAARVPWVWLQVDTHAEAGDAVLADGLSEPGKVVRAVRAALCLVGPVAALRRDHLLQKDRGLVSRGVLLASVHLPRV